MSEHGEEKKQKDGEKGKVTATETSEQKQGQQQHTHAENTHHNAMVISHLVAGCNNPARGVEKMGKKMREMVGVRC